VPAKLICFGDLCIDVVGTPNHSQTGSDITLNQLSIRPGGAALNCAIAAAAEGIDAAVMGLLGDDPFADLLLNHLAASPVGVQYIRRVPGHTGTVISLVGTAGQTRFYSYRGVNSLAYGALPASADCIYVSGYSFQDPESRLTAEALLASGLPCALDPSYQYARQFRAESLPVAYLLPNLEEARLMTGLESPPDCASALHQLGVGTVVIKLGPDGCYVSAPGLADFLPSNPVCALDTTGAGDAFAGVFLASLLKGETTMQAARRANHAACRLVSTKRP
jgi:sugar/nucleoside kinase (ribokinase family)